MVQWLTYWALNLRSNSVIWNLASFRYKYSLSLKFLLHFCIPFHFHIYEWSFVLFVLLSCFIIFTILLITLIQRFRYYFDYIYYLRLLWLITFFYPLITFIITSISLIDHFYLSPPMLVNSDLCSPEEWSTLSVVLTRIFYTLYLRISFLDVLVSSLNLLYCFN